MLNGTRVHAAPECPRTKCVPELVNESLGFVAERGLKVFAADTVEVAFRLVVLGAENVPGRRVLLAPRRQLIR